MAKTVSLPGLRAKLNQEPADNGIRTITIAHDKTLAFLPRTY